MQINPNGEEISVSERLEDIKERYGEYSDDYLTACDVAYSAKLTAINLGANSM